MITIKKQCHESLEAVHTHTHTQVFYQKRMEIICSMRERYTLMQ
jgi:hypothetical protein